MVSKHILSRKSQGLNQVFELGGLILICYSIIVNGVATGLYLHDPAGETLNWSRRSFFLTIYPTFHLNTCCDTHINTWLDDRQQTSTLAHFRSSTHTLFMLHLSLNVEFIQDFTIATVKASPLHTLSWLFGPPTRSNLHDTNTNTNNFKFLFFLHKYLVASCIQ